MIMQIYQADEFISGIDSEQRLLYFESRKGKRQLCNSFEDFIKLCMVYEIRFDAVYTNRLLSIYEIEEKIDKAYQTEVKTIPNKDFLLNEQLCSSPVNELIHRKFDKPIKILRCVSVYKQEWNEQFHIAECENGYCGCNWSTSS